MKSCLGKGWLVVWLVLSDTVADVRSVSKVTAASGVANLLVIVAHYPHHVAPCSSLGSMCTLRQDGYHYNHRTSVPHQPGPTRWGHVQPAQYGDVVGNATAQTTDLYANLFPSTPNLVLPAYPQSALVSKPQPAG